MEEKKPANTEEQLASPPAPGRGRRRFLQGSLGVALKLTALLGD